MVVGYGAIQKRSVSTAISTVKGGKISDMPTSNISQSLVGMSSGITLQQISGEPGAAPAIRVRGSGSINSGNDLYLSLTDTRQQTQNYSTISTLRILPTSKY